MAGASSNSPSFTKDTRFQSPHASAKFFEMDFCPPEEAQETKSAVNAQQTASRDFFIFASKKYFILIKIEPSKKLKVFPKAFNIITTEV